MWELFIHDNDGASLGWLVTSRDLSRCLAALEDYPNPVQRVTLRRFG